jgi:hypothetical protein
MAIRRKKKVGWGQADTKWRSDSEHAFMPEPIKLFIGLLKYRCEVGNFTRRGDLRSDNNA